MLKKIEMLDMEGPVSDRIPMDRRRRAKQFAPFQALKGFEHSVKEKEVVYERRREQYDGMRIALDKKLSEIENREVKVTYYLESSIKPGFGTYLDVYGIPKLFPHLRRMQIGGLDLSFDDIVDLEAADV